MVMPMKKRFVMVASRKTLVMPLKKRSVISASLDEKTFRMVSVSAKNARGGNSDSFSEHTVAAHTAPPGFAEGISVQTRWRANLHVCVKLDGRS